MTPMRDGQRAIAFFVALWISLFATLYTISCSRTEQLQQPIYGD